MDYDYDWYEYHDPDYPIDDGRDDDYNNKNKPDNSPDDWANDGGC